MYKKGQFFILAAVIAAIVILAIGVSYNSVKSYSPDFKLDYLANEIKQEIANSIDYSLMNDVSISETVQNLTSIYSTLNPDKDLFVLYGPLPTPQVLYYKHGVPSTDYSVSFIGSSAILSLDSDSFKYSFNLFQGQNLNILLKKSSGGELYVSTL